MKKLLFIISLFICQAVLAQNTTYECRYDKFGKKGNNTSNIIEITNISSSNMRNKIIEIDLDSLSHKLDKNKIVAENLLSKEKLDVQYIEAQNKLLIMLDIAKGTTVKIKIKEGKVKEQKDYTFGRYVPERKDDFAWENNKIAFRMYGPALEAEGEISSGIDVWVKKTEDLVIDKWYKKNDYHKDHGEGGDFYKVGASLGAGASAVWEDGKLFMSKNWTDYKVLCTGKLRTTFVLNYADYKVKNRTISVRREISLDAFSNLNHSKVVYTSSDGKDIKIAIGIKKRKGKGEIKINEKSGYVAYIEPTNKKHGTTAVGISTKAKIIESRIDKDHIFIIVKVKSGEVLNYRHGAYWDKSEQFKNSEEWFKYLNDN